MIGAVIWKRSFLTGHGLERPHFLQSLKVAFLAPQCSHFNLSFTVQTLPGSHTPPPRRGENNSGTRDGKYFRGITGWKHKLIPNTK